jgi:molybdopterin synthase catalytic subunit/molybdopterin converting factor small subunit
MIAVRVRVLFFGRLREIVGRESDLAEMNAEAKVEDLFARYSGRFPELADLRPSVAPSVNQEFASWQAVLHADDEVGFLPPVSGGSGRPAVSAEEVCELLERPIAREEWLGSVAGAADGAVVVFEGVARNHSRGRRVLRLEYEAYQPMARKKMRELAAELRKRFDVSRVVMVHRLGRIEIGETSILIGVSSAHRQAAFDAGRYAIDAFKRTVPIWKKEILDDGSAWAEGERPEVAAG